MWYGMQRVCRTMVILDWIERWEHVLPVQAVTELRVALDPAAHVIPEPDGKSEGALQAQIRGDAAIEWRTPLWRNNNGAMTTDDGRHVRFGLGNDSAALNRKWKSSDLIGIRPLLITTAHVGQTVGQFLAAEIKAPGWHLVPSDKRATAQAAFMASVRSFGGCAGFVQSRDDFRRLMKGET